MGRNDNCWGCGYDYQKFWGPEDLSEIEVEGKKHLMCPDCLEEIDPGVWQSDWGADRLS